jgi:hypothetical protein
MRRELVVVVLLAGSLSVAASAAANDGQWPMIYELVQQGQDVEVTLSLWPPEGSPLEHCFSGDPWDNTLYLVREDRATDERIVVLDDIRLTVEFTPVGHSPDFCDDPDPVFCAENDCEDCDGDSVPECPELCCHEDLYVVVDECVPPGEYRYLSLEESDSFNWIVDQMQIDVVDNGYNECAPGDDGGDDCGCSAPGSMGGGPLALVLLGCGLTALYLGRRRRSAK